MVSQNIAFNITSPTLYFDEIVIPQYRAFIQNNGSSKEALLAVITLHHMHDWVYGENFCKQTSSVDLKLHPHFETMRLLANGVKHSFLGEDKNEVYRAKTHVNSSGFSSGFSMGFQRRLIVEVEQQKISIDQLLQLVMDYWLNIRATGKF